MSDIALVYDDKTQTFDIALNGIGDLQSDTGLRSAIALSLFCHRQADASDTVADGSANRRGWWADALVVDDLIGSRLWLLDRSKLTSEALRLAELYAAESLQWFIDDNIASDIIVIAATQGDKTMCLNVEVYRNKAAPLRFTFDNFWSQQ